MRSLLGVFIALGMGSMAPHLATAKAKLTVGVAPAVHKMSKYKNSGDLYPLQGPLIRVYSSDGKTYDRIANDNRNMNFLVDVWAVCNRKIRDLTLTIHGESRNVKYTSNKGKQVKRRTEHLKTPFTLPKIGLEPAQACRKELDKRVALGHKSRNIWMKTGFVVKYDNAYEAKVTGSCSATLGRGDIEVEKTALPVWIICEAVKGGQQPKPDKGSGQPARPKFPAEPVKPVKLDLSLKVTPAVVQKCPASLKFTGKIKSTGAGVVRYRIVGRDGAKAWQTPVRTVKFDRAGIRSLSSWTHHYHSPGLAGNLTVQPPGRENMVKGSARIVMVEKPDGTSVIGGAATYRIWCNAPPDRLRMNR